MTDGALLKVERAVKHIADLDDLLGRTKPFSLILETDTQAGERTLGCEKNQPIIDCVALLCGDAIHNLRSALDYAYWEIVSPLCSSEKLGNVQFPFSKTEDTLDKELKKRQAPCRGESFCSAIRSLRPYSPPKGNLRLFLIHQLDVTDKHKLLLPAAEQTTHTFAWLDRVDPGFPWKGGAGSFTLSEGATYTWPNNAVPADQLGIQTSPHMFKRFLDVPVDVIFPITLPPNLMIKMPPVVPMLHGMLNAVCEAIEIMRKAVAPS